VFDTFEVYRKLPIKQNKMKH